MATNVEIVDENGFEHSAQDRNPVQGRACYGLIDQMLSCGFVERFQNDGSDGGDIVIGSVALCMGGRIFRPVNHAALIHRLQTENDGADADFVPLVEMLRDDPSLWLATC